MFALEGLRLATTDLQVEESCQVGDFLLHSLQSDKTVKLLQAISDIHRLWSLIWNILLIDGHQFLITHR